MATSSCWAAPRPCSPVLDRPARLRCCCRWLRWRSALAGVVAAHIAILPLARVRPRRPSSPPSRSPPSSSRASPSTMGAAPRTAPAAGRQRLDRGRGPRAWPPAAGHHPGRRRAGRGGVVPARAHAGRPAHARGLRRPPHGARRRHPGRPLRHPVAGPGRRAGRRRGPPARPSVPDHADPGRGPHAQGLYRRALGGWGSVPGALIGALGIGLFETFVSPRLGRRLGLGRALCRRARGAGRPTARPVRRAGGRRA